MATDSQGPTIMAVAIVFGVIAAIVIILRLWARVFLVKHVGFDDGEFVRFSCGFSYCFAKDTLWPF